MSGITKTSSNKERKGVSSCGITAIKGVLRYLRLHERREKRSNKVAGALERSPSPHGGRGALPSEGGSPSDLLFLAGGGRIHSLPLSFPLIRER